MYRGQVAKSIKIVVRRPEKNRTSHWSIMVGQVHSKRDQQIDGQGSMHIQCGLTMSWVQEYTPVFIRAVPFEKLVGGVSGVRFSDHPAAIFHFFLGYPAVIFFPLTQCKKRPVRPPRSDFGTILRPPRGIFLDAHQTPAPLTFQME